MPADQAPYDREDRFFEVERIGRGYTAAQSGWVVKVHRWLWENNCAQSSTGGRCDVHLGALFLLWRRFVFLCNCPNQTKIRTSMCMPVCARCAHPATSFVSDTRRYAYVFSRRVYCFRDRLCRALAVLRRGARNNSKSSSVSRIKCMSGRYLVPWTSRVVDTVSDQ